MRRFPSVFILTILIVVLPFYLPVFAGERFTDNKSSTITGHQLGLMWAATDGPGDIDWPRTRKWICFTCPLPLPVQNENRRLPTLKKLISLHEKDKGRQGCVSTSGRHLRVIPEMQLSCVFIWSGDRQGISAAVFNFKLGTFYSDRLVHKRGYRALAV